MKKIHITLLLAFSLVFILGCQLVSNPPLPEDPETELLDEEPVSAPPTVVPVDTDVPAPEPTEATPMLQSGDMIFSTSFDTIDDWEVLTDNEEISYTTEIRGDGLYVEVPETYDFWYAYAPLGTAYEDVRVEADVELVGGTNYTYITLTCRSSDQGEYVFFMDTGGYWQIGKYIFGDESSYERLGEGGSTKIKVAKHPNHITAICKGTKLTMLVNNNEVGSVEDSHLTSGLVGIGVETFDYPTSQVMFHNLEIYVP